MCTRIFNNLKADSPMTARNMDWLWPVNAYFYTFPAGANCRGMDLDYAREIGISESQIFNWRSKYSSISSLMGDKSQGFAAVDGLNDQGLVANGLYDESGTYTEPTREGQYLSANRWVQFALDSFKNVNEAAEYFSSQAVNIVPQPLPDPSNMPSLLHLTLSDSSGDSAIIEIQEGNFVVYHDRDFRVATNEPDYATQQTLLAYWRYIWGLNSNASTENPISSAPGGNSPTQRFERASYYLSFADKATSHHEALTQARSLVASCAVPVGFNPYHENEASYTIWANTADHIGGKYFLTNTTSMNTVWLSFEEPITTCQHVFLQQEKCATPVPGVTAGDVSSLLRECSNPFS
ncbi:linear amide C-N hydrolase [Vibrio rhodolitus]|uniref:linear amide C-N hydrolase n=1 Tax=Vibrio rhodolitus TaxID=2231649 RepID=UPI000E0C75D2|nr:linear amide C-N hydrolase [Vibrio rhodolitus]